jgi:hypothetical protein
MWLYALVRLLTENEPVIHHSGAGTFLFFGNSVYSLIPGVIPNFPQVEHPTFCLIDPDETKDETEHRFSDQPQARQGDLSGSGVISKPAPLQELAKAKSTCPKGIHAFVDEKCVGEWVRRQTCDRERCSDSLQAVTAGDGISRERAPYHS